MAQSVYLKAWQKAHPEKMRAYGRKWRYGISSADYERMFQDQKGLCKLCREKPIGCVDHDHVTGRVRGLLCQGCNTGLGRFGDDPVKLTRAIEYLNGA